MKEAIKTGIKVGLKIGIALGVAKVAYMNIVAFDRGFNKAILRNIEKLEKSLDEALEKAEKDDVDDDK